MIIKQNIESITAEYNYIFKHRNVLIIYIDNSDINSRVRAAVISFFTEEKKAVYLNAENIYTVYFAELYKIKMTLKIARN